MSSSKAKSSAVLGAGHGWAEQRLVSSLVFLGLGAGREHMHGFFCLDFPLAPWLLHCDASPTQQ